MGCLGCLDSLFLELERPMMDGVRVLWVLTPVLEKWIYAFDLSRIKSFYSE